MALRRSQGLLNKMLGLRATVAAIVTHGVDSAALTFNGTSDQIECVGDDLIVNGFMAGMEVTVFGTSSNNGVTGALIQSVAATYLQMDAAVLAQEAGAANMSVIAARGGSMKDIMANGVIRVYSGAQPATPEAAVTGTLLIEITVASGAFVAGLEASGLEFGDPVTNYIEKCADEVWSGVGLAAGTAGWFRFVANPTDGGGLDTALPRIDGTVGISGADAAISNTQIAVGATYTLDTMKLTAPMQYGA